MTSPNIANIVLATILSLCSTSPSVSLLHAQGTGTPMPIPLAQWFSNAGAVLGAGGFCVFAAGTTTLATTYTTKALSVANSNPILFNSAGRASSGGVFLSPGTSYKFVLKDFTGVGTPTCVPDTGTTIWTVDNVDAVPAATAALDITATAGETLAAGEVTYLSDGSGGKVAGQFYKADADLFYGSVLPQVGLAVSAISSGAQGSVRLAGRLTGLSGLTAGLAYYISATAGALTATPPGMVRYVGQAESATVLVIGTRATVIQPTIPCGRVTLTSAAPVTTADVTAATTVYYTPYGGCNTVSVYDGSAVWYPRTFTEISLAVPNTTSTMYDLFVYDNAGTLTLETTAWTNDTTRATALTTQNGVYVRTGALTRRYVGSFRTTGVAGQTEDSETKRYVWNYYHRVARKLKKLDTTATWTYNAAAWRQARAQSANQVDFVVGVSEDSVTVSLGVMGSIGVGASWFAVGVALDAITPTADTIGPDVVPSGAGEVVHLAASYVGYPGIGRHFVAWCEYGNAGANVTFYGVGATTGATQSGLLGWMWG